ncbi:MAG: S8 family serine peptidase [bacterium]|nr:S8 family serine peptidase [bacterium]
MLRRIAILLLLSLPAFSLYKEEEVLVKFRNGVSPASIKSKATNILSIEPLFETTYKISFSKSSVEEMIKTLQSNPDIIYAEPNYIRHICGTPNDTYFGNQWGLPKIQAPSAWDIEKGTETVIIAITDTGIDYNHEDLKDKVIGSSSFVIAEPDPMDGHGHGTHVAGIAAASTNNGTGTAGVAWNCKILAIKVLNKKGEGDDAGCANGIRYAADNGTRVINMSWGGKTPPALTLKGACNYAYGKGCLLVAAAGNDGSTNMFYPAGYENVFSVAATNSNDKKAWFSNYGTWVDVFAPGQNIYSTTRNNSYGYMDGTSMATPFVSGLTGLLFSKYSTSTNIGIAQTIKETADVVNGLKRINCYNALQAIPQNPETKRWTFIVYLDGDNDLEPDAINDFLEMAQVGSTDKVNIVVQFDRIPGYDSRYGNWTNTKRFYITKNMTPISGSATMDIGEANMGGTQTLIDFVEWTKSFYPAEHYGLIFWNHGSGWRASEKRQKTKAVCEDVTSEDCLYMKEVSSALSQVGKIDLIGFDACFMAMTEVAYEIKDFGDVMVGSEETEPANGWPYNTILADLIGSPTMTARNLGRIIVEKYGQFYLGQSNITQSAIDLLLMDSFTQSIDLMIDNIWGKWDEIGRKRDLTGSVSVSYADIFHFSQLMAATLTVNPIISNHHSSNHPNLQGLTIYFPKTDDDSEYDFYTAYNISFPAHSNWDEFLNDFLTKATVTVKNKRIIVYPNPYNPNKGHKKITFNALPKDSHVKIYNIAGELVKELIEKEREAIWEDPETLASGIYIYLIQGPGGIRHIGKIGIVK